MSYSSSSKSNKKPESAIVFDNYLESLETNTEEKYQKHDQNFYDILGITPNCTTSGIKKAYRRVVLQEHPDKGGKAENFQAAVLAYNILKDKEFRKIHDEFGKAEALRYQNLLNEMTQHN